MIANNRIYTVLQGLPHTAVIELATGVAMFGWGAWLLNPFMFSFSVNPGYNIMAQLAPEWAWGLFGVLAGASQLYGLFLNNRNARKIGAMSILVFRIFTLTLTGIQNNWQIPSVVDFAMWAALSAWVYVRL